MGSGELDVPGTKGFCKFVEAYFIGHDYNLDTKSKAGHDVYRIPNHPHNISVPRGYDRLKMGTFQGLLEDVGITTKEYRELAGTKDKLSRFCKQQRRQADTSGEN